MARRSRRIVSRVTFMRTARSAMVTLLFSCKSSFMRFWREIASKSGPPFLINKCKQPQRLRKYVGMLSTVIMARADKALAISISLREVNNE